MNLLKYISFVLFGIVLWVLAYHTSRQLFGQLFALFSVLFIVYIYLIFSLKNVREIYFMGIFFRVILLGAIPNLSDDFYRFIWDGKLVQNGVNPFLYLPDEYHSIQAVCSETWLFSKLNSPHYYSVYPPLNQLFFGIATYFSDKNIVLNVIFLRIILCIADIVNLNSIHHWTNTTIRREALSIYAFNPLIIIELCGNLHFEGVMIMFVLLAYRWIEKNTQTFSKEFVLSAFFMSCAIMTKLLPLLLFPIILRLLGLKKGLIYICFCMLFSVFFFIPFFNLSLFHKLSSSIGLYYQKFEFNASFYYIFRKIGYYFVGYNMIEYIGKIMAMLVFLGVFYLTFRSKNIKYIPSLVLFLFYAFATTIHPWYIINVLVAGIFCGLRFGILWTYLVMLSYFTYRSIPYEESYILVAIEYLPVYIFASYELHKKSTLLFSNNILNNFSGMHP